MRRYETIFILRPSLNEEEINSVIENTSTIISECTGKIIDLDRWGMRKLAYPIKKESQGFYVLCDYTATPEAVAEIERKFRIDDAVLRYMSVKLADSITDAEIEEAKDLAANKKVADENEESAETEVEETEEIISEEE